VKNRIATIAGITTAILLITSLSWALTDSSSTTSSTSSTSTTAVTTLAVAEQLIPVPGAGSVRVGPSAAGIRVIEVTTLPGFSHEVEVGDGQELEIQFNGPGVRFDVNLELEDGVIRVRITQSTAAVTGSTTTTVDDDDVNGVDDVAEVEDDEANQNDDDEANETDDDDANETDDDEDSDGDSSNSGSSSDDEGSDDDGESDDD
jgi:hypothetical protein